MEKISLSNLQQIIKQTLDKHLDISYWVVAEINELKVNSNGHCYLELVEKDNESQFIRAKLSSTIWSSTFGMLKSYFETATGHKLEAGLTVLVKANVQYHVLYGISLNITDIEPSYTVGELLLQRRKTIQRLQTEGVFEMNREIYFPVLPQRVALISSDKAAGYQDFIQHLQNNEYGYSFSVSLFPSTMQGKAAESSIINAFNVINAQADKFDVVVIIRGGGSQSDLSCFDAYNLAFHAAQFPLPLLTGIGHDKDLSVLDMVANQHLKTPTAVADFLIATLASVDAQLDAWAERMEEYAKRFIAEENNKIQQLANQLKSSLVACFTKETAKLEDWLPARIKTVGLHLLSNQAQKLKFLEMQVHTYDPMNMLGRGYSLTLHRGRVIRSANEVKVGDQIETILLESRFTSVVESQQ